MPRVKHRLNLALKGFFNFFRELPDQHETHQMSNETKLAPPWDQPLYW